MVLHTVQVYVFTPAFSHCGAVVTFPASQACVVTFTVIVCDKLPLLAVIVAVP